MIPIADLPMQICLRRLGTRSIKIREDLTDFFGLFLGQRPLVIEATASSRNPDTKDMACLFARGGLKGLPAMIGMGRRIFVGMAQLIQFTGDIVEPALLLGD